MSRVGQYYLSPQAREVLVKQAIQKGFVKPQKKYARGISAYIEWLSQQKFYDDRPEAVKESNIDRLKTNKMPYWDKGYTRKVYCFSLSITALESFRAIATQFLISNSYRKDGLYRETTSIVSSTLEAIGIGWLKVAENL